MLKVKDIVYVSYSTPNLDEAAEFLKDFGLVVAQQTPDRLYMRGACNYPYVYICERGEPSFVAVALLVNSAADLEEAAKLPGSSAVEPLEGPGGGSRVRLKAPDGYRVDLVHGMTPVEPLKVRNPLKINFAFEKNRVDALQRPTHEPAQVVRLGHCVLKFNNGTKAAEWFRDTLGMLFTDRLYIPGDPKNTLGIFMRCDRGNQPADHHTIFVLDAPGDINVHHVSFEVQDPDAVHIGHDWLRDKGWKASWGVGRHTLGSQIFDYWRSPTGFLMEHYADGDMLTADVKAGDHPATDENLAQWGPAIDPKFFDSIAKD